MKKWLKAMSREFFCQLSKEEEGNYGVVCGGRWNFQGVVWGFICRGFCYRKHIWRKEISGLREAKYKGESVEPWSSQVIEIGGFLLPQATKVLPLFIVALCDP